MQLTGQDRTKVLAGSLKAPKHVCRQPWVCAYLDNNPEIKSKPALNSYHGMLNTSVCLEREFPQRLDLGKHLQCDIYGTNGRQAY